MKEVLVSIIMPAFNCADYIKESVQSVLDQTYNSWELIIIDDCSTDNTEFIIKDSFHQESRVRYHRLKKNSGAAIARNTGTEMAKGQMIAFLDSDDLWHKEKLTQQIAFMQENGYTFTFTAYEHIDESGNRLNKRIKAKKKVNYNGVLLNCPIGNSTVIYDCSRLGKFEIPDIRKRNDDALWLKILKKESYAYGYDEVLMYYRVRSNSLSRNKFELIKYHWYLYREIEKLSIIRSAWHIVCWSFIKIFKLKG